MNGVDKNDLFALVTASITTADTIAKDQRMPSGDRAAAARLADSLKSWRSVAYAFREWQPAAVVKA